jgi:hypothetical protein
MIFYRDGQFQSLWIFAKQFTVLWERRPASPGGRARFLEWTSARFFLIFETGMYGSAGRMSTMIA